MQYCIFYLRESGLSVSGSRKAEASSVERSVGSSGPDMEPSRAYYGTRSIRFIVLIYYSILFPCFVELAPRDGQVEY